MHKHLPTSVLLWIICLLLSSFTQAQIEVPPNIQWKTAKTAHFEIIYNAKQQELGFLYAEKLEAAYKELQKYFKTMPKKTIVIINDKMDVTNGYATRLPYPHIMIYPTLPGPEESLADTGDWALELLAHEFTHILTFEPANGIMAPLRGIFGNIIAPNILLPQWWKEGIAVDIETRIGNNGRLRSFFQDATLRAMVDDESIYEFDIAEANEALPSWPKGMRPYLFGSLMWSKMIADRGTKIISELNERYGGRVPYLIEAPAKDVLNRSYTSEYNHMLDELVERTQVQLKTLREAPTTNPIIPKNNYLAVTAPSISPDGKHLAVVAEDDTHSRAIKIITRGSEAESFLDAKSADTVEKFNESREVPATQDAPPSGSIQRISWFPNSQKIIYDKVDFINRIERYSDLYSYDLVAKKTQSLTKGLRGREPTVSPDSEKVAFVKLAGGKTELAILKLNEPQSPAEVLYTPALQERISYPIFWDQETLIFSLRKLDGTEHLYRLNLTSKEVTVLFPEYRIARFPRKTPEGLLFTSGQNGVLNLYLTNPDLTNPRPITNTTTAFFSADMDPVRKEIFASHMTSQGLKVAAVLPNDWQNTPAIIPQISALMSDRYPPKETSPLEMPQIEVEDYSPAKYLWPQYWMPFVAGSSSETGTILQARTSGFDPLKKHAYSLIGSWDTALNRGSIEGAYINQTTRLPLAITAYKRSTYLGNLSNELIDKGGALTALPSLFRFSRHASLQAGWQYLERSTATRSITRTGPYGMLAYTNYSQSGAQISPESGGGAYFGVSNYIAQPGLLDHSQFQLGGEIYLSSLLPKHHAIMLRTNVVATPEIIHPAYGVSTEPLVFVADSPLPQYILRGYQRGQIYGNNLVAFSAEYRFPLKDIYRGSGTDPLFIRRFSGALVTDGVAADGIFQSLKLGRENVTFDRSFWSAGAEMKIETTLGYIIPLNLVLGYYVAFNSGDGPEGVLGTTVQVSGF